MKNNEYNFIFDSRDQFSMYTGSYDANGNTLKDEGGNATGDLYNAENHLVKRNGTTTIQVGYGFEGNRAWKSVGTTTTYYLLDDRNPSGYVQVLAEFANTPNAPDRVYAYGLELVSMQVNNSTLGFSASTNYYGYDGQGSVRLIVGGNASGPLTNTYDYDAYGMALAVNEGIVNNYRYTGQQWDLDLGMYYQRTRYYNPQVARFWTMDSFEGNSEDPLSLHKYLYCMSDPVNAADPSGQYSSYEQVLGYDAEEALQDLYEEEHPGDLINKNKRIFRADKPLRWLFPDIYNVTKKEWLEIKPLSISGVAAGEAKRFLNSKALPGSADASWVPPVLVELGDGEQIVCVNVLGVVYYQSADLVDKELITVIAAGGVFLERDLLKYVFQRGANAVVTGGLRLRPALTYSTSLAEGGKTADIGRAEMMWGTSAILGLMGGIAP